jgi:hypothetical protein
MCCPQVSAIDSCIREPQGRGKCAKVRWHYSSSRTAYCHHDAVASAAVSMTESQACTLPLQVQEPMDNAQF